MINITIGLDGTVNKNKIILGNKLENNDEVIDITVPEEYANFKMYMIAVIKPKGSDKITRLLPINDNRFSISNQLTLYSGNWTLYVMLREQELDLNQDNVDIRAKNNEHVFISNGFTGIINDNLIEKYDLENIPLDTNLKPIYEDLLELKEQCEELLQIPNANEVMY